MSSLGKVQIDFLIKNKTQICEIAISVNKSIFDLRKFDETVSHNFRANVLVTLDRSEAVKWLELDMIS
jgi:hypothetical protein